MINQIFRGKGSRGGRGGRRQGRNKGNKSDSGPGGNCVCPNCGHKVSHQAGQRCLDMNCPKCGTKMMRE